MHNPTLMTPSILNPTTRKTRTVRRRMFLPDHPLLRRHRQDPRTMMHMIPTRHLGIDGRPPLEQDVKLLLPDMRAVVDVLAWRREVQLRSGHLVHGEELRQVVVGVAVPVAALLVLRGPVRVVAGRGDPVHHEHVVGAAFGYGFVRGGAAVYVAHARGVVLLVVTTGPAGQDVRESEDYDPE